MQNTFTEPAAPRTVAVGVRRFKATRSRRRWVLLLSTLGFPQREIARAIDTSPRTLRKYFRSELNLASAAFKTRIAPFVP